VSPGEELVDELVGDGVALEEPGAEPLAEEAHQEGGVPPGQADEDAVCGEAAVGGEDVQLGVPLEEVAGGGEGDGEAQSDDHSSLLLRAARAGPPRSP